MAGLQEKIEQAGVPRSRIGRPGPGQEPIDFPEQGEKSLLEGMDPFAEELYISRKRNRGDFVLVRVLGATCYSVMHYVAIEGQVRQMEVRYIEKAYELACLFQLKSRPVFQLKSIPVVLQG